MVTFDIAQDFKDVLDFTEAITVNFKGTTKAPNNAGVIIEVGESSEAVAIAQKRVVTLKEASQSNGQINVGDVKFNFAVEDITKEIKTGDTITAADTLIYTVKIVEKITDNSIFKVITTRA